MSLGRWIEGLEGEGEDCDVARGLLAMTGREGWILAMTGEDLPGPPVLGAGRVLGRVVWCPANPGTGEFEGKPGPRVLNGADRVGSWGVP